MPLSYMMPLQPYSDFDQTSGDSSHSVEQSELSASTSTPNRLSPEASALNSTKDMDIPPQVDFSDLDDYSTITDTQAAPDNEDDAMKSELVDSIKSEIMD